MRVGKQRGGRIGCRRCSAREAKDAAALGDRSAVVELL